MMSQKTYTSLFQIFGLLALVVLLGSTVGDAYAREYLAPPDVPISEIRSGEWSPPEQEFRRYSQVVEVYEPVTQIKQFGNFTAILRPLYTTVDDPALHIVGPGGPLAGVGSLMITVPSEGTFGCTGSLLLTGRHILTAAHCVTNAAGVLEGGTTGSVLFEGASGPEIISFVDITPHPDWDSDLFKGNDIAIVELLSTASASIPRYDTDRDGSNDLGVPFVKAGYGLAGLGTTGATFGDGFKREGKNLYDALADLMLTTLPDPPFVPGVDFVPGSVLQYDFDNGLAANDAFGFFLGISELGLGTDEVNSASGDSGGPTFGSPVITGITSYGLTLTLIPPCFGPCTSDFTTLGGEGFLDSSFGEFSGDTRVFTYSGFIDGFVIFCDRPISDFDNVIMGTAGDDTIGGTSGDDLIDGKGGADSIKGNDGDDCLIGGDGDDRLSGGNGADYLQGDAGADSLNGRSGDDFLTGGTGDDKLSGSSGNDEIHGGAGNDHLTGRGGIDMLFGEGDNDILSGGAGNDPILDGGPGDDIVLGRAGNDSMFGGIGSDICDGGSGADTADAECEIATSLPTYHIILTEGVGMSGI